MSLEAQSDDKERLHLKWCRNDNLINRLRQSESVPLKEPETPSCVSKGRQAQGEECNE